MADFNFVNPPSPASYQGVRVDFSPLADIPQAAFDATQRARTLRLQQPIIDPATGRPSTDPGLILQELLRREGAPASQRLMEGLLPYRYGAQVGASAARNYLSGPGLGEIPEVTPPIPGQPGLVTPPGPRSEAPGAPAQPKLSSAGTDNAGDLPTINNALSEVFGESPKYQAAAERVLASWKQAGAVDTGLSPERFDAVKKSLELLKRKVDGGETPAGGKTAALPESGSGPEAVRTAKLETGSMTDTNGPPMSGQSDDVGGQTAEGQNGRAAVPPFMGGTLDGAPAPETRTPPVRTAQAAPAGRPAWMPPESREPQAGAPAGGAGYPSQLVPRQFQGREAAYADMLDQQAQRYQAAYLSQAYIPGGQHTATAYKDQADRLGKQASLIREWIKAATTPTQKQLEAREGGYPDVPSMELDVKNRELTGPQKEAFRAGFKDVGSYEAAKAADVEAAKKNVDADNNKYVATQSDALQYEGELSPLLRLTKGILNRPDFYSGFLGPEIVELKKIKNFAMNDREAGVLEQGFEKITAASTLSMLNSQKFQQQEGGGGSQSGRVFQAQVDQVIKAVPDMHKTVAGNLFLVHVQMRMGELKSHIAEMQRDYRDAHGGRLGTGWDAELSNYLRKNPVFSADEQANPALLSKPDMPEKVWKGSDEAKIGWIKSMKLKPGKAQGDGKGDVFRSPDGQYMHVEPSVFAPRARS